MKEFRNFTVVHDSDWKVLAWRSRPVTGPAQTLCSSDIPLLIKPLTIIIDSTVDIFTYRGLSPLLSTVQWTSSHTVASHRYYRQYSGHLHIPWPLTVIIDSTVDIFTYRGLSPLLSTVQWTSSHTVYCCARSCVWEGVRLAVSSAQFNVLCCRLLEGNWLQTWLHRSDTLSRVRYLCSLEQNFSYSVYLRLCRSSIAN